MAKRKNKIENENKNETAETPKKAPNVLEQARERNLAQQIVVGLTEDGRLDIVNGELGYGPLTYMLSRALFFVQAHELNNGANTDKEETASE